MKITLKKISFSPSVFVKYKTLLYADFNVLNHLYEKRIIPSEPIIFFPDSTLVYFVLCYYYKYHYRKLISTDLLETILKWCDVNKQKIFLFGDTDECLFQAKNKISFKYKNLVISSIQCGYNYNNDLVLENINKVKPDVLFVGLGAGRQEKWIIENCENIKTALIISVGGWFQYLSGSKKRAPLTIRKLNLEWLYKLINEFPRVWKRYLFGGPKFLYRILTKKIVLIVKEAE